MATNIEKLLRMTADFHNFCGGDFTEKASPDQDELSVEELDFVAAAAGIPVKTSYRREEETKSL